MKKFSLYSVIFIVAALIIFYYLQLSNVEGKSLIPIAVYDLKIPEPSGLCFDKNNNTLWAVSDDNGIIYNIDQKGKIIEYIETDEEDLEGVSLIGKDLIVIVLEGKREVLYINKDGEKKRRIQIQLKGKENSGLEGITYNNNTSELYLVNEKDPGILVRIDSTGKSIEKTILNYTSDYSGLFYEEKNKNLWIISDEENSIMKFSSKGELLDKYYVNIQQIEGIAIDIEKSKLFLVSDYNEELYIFDLP